MCRRPSRRGRRSLARQRRSRTGPALPILTLVPRRRSSAWTRGRVVTGRSTLPTFGEFPPEYQRLLHLAEEQFGFDVTPLAALKGGRTEALLYLASVSARGRRHVEHLVLKLDRINERARTSEIERHRLASSQAPPAFATRNMARLAYEVESGDCALLHGCRPIPPAVPHPRLRGAPEPPRSAF